jgi:hypothetical protein
VLPFSTVVRGRLFISRACGGDGDVIIEDNLEGLSRICG